MKVKLMFVVVEGFCLYNSNSSDGHKTMIILNLNFMCFVSMELNYKLIYFLSYSSVTHNFKVGYRSVVSQMK